MLAYPGLRSLSASPSPDLVVGFQMQACWVAAGRRLWNGPTQPPVLLTSHCQFQQLNAAVACAFCSFDRGRNEVDTCTVWRGCALCCRHGASALTCALLSPALPALAGPVCRRQHWQHGCLVQVRRPASMCAARETTARPKSGTPTLTGAYASTRVREARTHA